MSLIKRINRPNRYEVAGFTNGVFDEFFNSAFSGVDTAVVVNPKIDISENDAEHKVVAEIPGVGKDEFSIEVVDQKLILKGEKSEESKEDSEKYTYRERSTGSFKRVVTLPRNIDSQKIDARLKDGILTITIPKQEDAKPRKIEVQFEEQTK